MHASRWDIAGARRVGGFAMRWTRLGLVVAALVLAAELPADDPKTDQKIDIFADLNGKPAPEIGAGDFTLNGAAVKLADLKGKVVLLEFWAVCFPPCVDTMPRLRDWHARYHGKGL